MDHYMIRQELNPETCRLDEKHINLRRYTPDRHCENGSILWRDGKNHQNDVTTSYATASRCVTTVPFHGETDRITKWCDHQLCNSIQVRHYGSISWRDGQNHQMVPFSWRDGQNHQMMWPPAMQQHPGASLRFHFMARRTESPNDVTTSYATASRCIITVPFRGETDRITTCRYKILRPVSHPPNVHSFIGTARTNGAVPPAFFRKGEDGRKKKREVLHLLRCYTHTPGQSRVNPERQEKEKSGHTTGRRPKTAQGGEGNRRTSGTNLHGETDLAKTAHTPKPHDTLRRGTRGKLGTKWGTSWWQTRKPKQLVNQQDSVPNCLKVVRLFPAPGPWSSLAPIGIKQLSKSSELGAQYVKPHQTTKRKSHQTWKACACLQPFSWSCFAAKAEAAEKTRFLMVATAFTLIERQFGEEPWDSRIGETLWKGA